MKPKGNMSNARLLVIFGLWLAVRTTKAQDYFACYTCNSLDENKCKSLTNMEQLERTELIKECNIIQPGLRQACVFMASIRGDRFQYREVVRHCGVIFPNKTENYTCTAYQYMVDLSTNFKMTECKICNKSLCNGYLPDDKAVTATPKSCLIWAILAIINYVSR